MRRISPTIAMRGGLIVGAGDRHRGFAEHVVSGGLALFIPRPC